MRLGVVLFSRGSRHTNSAVLCKHSLGVVLFSRGSRPQDQTIYKDLCLGVVLFSRGSRLKYFNSGAE